jgi:hypothetical protein
MNSEVLKTLEQAIEIIKKEQKTTKCECVCNCKGCEADDCFLNSKAESKEGCPLEKKGQKQLKKLCKGCPYLSKEGCPYTKKGLDKVIQPVEYYQEMEHIDIPGTLISLFLFVVMLMMLTSSITKAMNQSCFKY